MGVAEVVRRSEPPRFCPCVQPLARTASARHCSSLAFRQASYYNASMLRAIGFLALSACLAASSFGQTPPPPAKADTSQEAFVFDRIENLVRFEEDGTGIRDTTAVIRVQSQAGVQEFGQLIFDYSQDTEKLEIQYVRVRKPDGQVIETPLSGAQDFAPEILKEAPMYSDYRQRHVSVSSLQPGDVP